MQKQFASFNPFVSRQTLSYSSCDGLCTDQNDTAADVHLCDDIAVVCSKLSPTSHLSIPKRSNLRELKAIRKRTQFAPRSKNTPQISPTSNDLTAPAPQAAGSLIKRLCAVLSAAAAFVV
jgi:hypothetical protein